MRHGTPVWNFVFWFGLAIVYLVGIAQAALVIGYLTQ